MLDYTQIELANEIMNTMLGTAYRKGFSPTSPKVKTLLKEQDEMRHFNMETIDKIINVYGKLIRKEVDSND